ncbi:hypothetical protein SUGI_1100120 [Cryptomeria japonica]|nr:hypothetical protein SUGI_1100120 [Cryptomeria japonica]
MEWVFWCLAAVCAGLILFLLKIATTIWWKPLQLKKSFEAQGIRGPPYSLFYGSTTDISRMMDEQKSKPMPLSHDILPRVLPHFHEWTKTYGQDFFFLVWADCQGLTGLTGEK